MPEKPLHGDKSILEPSQTQITRQGQDSELISFAPFESVSTSPVSSLQTPLLRHPALALHHSTPKGRGVFATAAIPGRTVIDVSPVLIFSAAEVETLKSTEAWNYIYLWPSKNTTAIESYRLTETNSNGEKGRQALPLGLGSMFNHSNHSRKLNVGWVRDIEREVIRYTTLRDIEEGEELCISYGASVWFGGVVEENESESDDGQQGDTEMLNILSED